MRAMLAQRSRNPELYVQARAAYLDAMGLKQWYARVHLSGAAPSSLALREVKKDGRQLQAEKDRGARKTELLQSDPSLSIKSLQENISRPPSDELRGEQSAPQNLRKEVGEAAEMASSPEKEGSHIVASISSGVAEGGVFSLRAFVSGDLVVTSEARAPSADSSETVLLKNILKLVVQDAPDEFMQAGFDWPVFQLPESQSIAAPALESMLGRWLAGLKPAGASRHIHFGAGVADALVEAARAQDNYSPGGFWSLPYSLEEMLMMPLKKASVWASLRSYLSHSN